MKETRVDRESENIKANHPMVYYIAADSYSDLKALYNAGIVDTHLVVHGGGNTPPQQFVTDCNNAKTSPILNNGNDGIAGWNGSDSYNANLAAMGIHAVGGESEQAAEIDSIMKHLVFMDYGGMGTGGGTNDDVWNVTHPGNVSGFGAVGYYETYDGSSNLWGWNTIGSGLTHAKAHGVKEIGLMVGSWMMSHSSAQDYVNLINSIESHGIQVAGIGVWSGYGNNMNSLYNQFASWYKTWQAIWPPNMTTLKNRMTAPPPGPAPTPVASHIPHIWSGLVGQATLYSGTQIVGTPVGTYGTQGWLDTATQNWVPTAKLTAAEKAGLIVPVTLSQGGVVLQTVTPDANGGFSATITSPNAGALHYTWKGKTGNTGSDMNMTWNPAPVAADGSQPAATVGQDGHIYMFVRGTDNALWYRTETTVGSWNSLGGILTAGPAAAALGSDVYIFHRGRDNAIYYCTLADHAWKSIGGTCTSGPAATVAGTKLDVFVRGSDKQLYKTTYDSTTKVWAPWVGLGGTIN